MNRPAQSESPVIIVGSMSVMIESTTPAPPASTIPSSTVDQSAVNEAFSTASANGGASVVANSAGEPVL